MKAIYLLGRDSLEMRDVPEPRIDGRNNVLVETDALSVCRTDIEIIHGTMASRKSPTIIGHEAAGRVVRVSGGVKRFKEGDRVLVDPNLSDLTCTACRLGLSHLCLNGGLMGRETDGVFVERLVIPSRNIHRLPQSVPVEVSPLIQPLSTAVHAVRKIELGPRSSVLILGLGATGLMLTQLASLKGARVVAASAARKRLDLAKKLGAETVVNKSDSDFVARVVEASQQGGVDVAIVATESPEVSIDACAKSVRPGGILLLFSIGAGKLELDTFQSYYKELTIKATRSSQPQDFEDAIRLVAEKKINLDYQVSGTFPFEKTVEAISFFQDRTRVLKTVILTSLA